MTDSSLSWQFEALVEQLKLRISQIMCGISASGDLVALSVPSFDSVALDGIVQADSTASMLPRAWEMGVHYELIPGRLFFSWHNDDEYTFSAIKRDRRMFYCSSHFAGQHLFQQTKN